MGDWILYRPWRQRIVMPLRVKEVNEQTGFVVGIDEHGNGDGYQLEMTAREIGDFPSDATEQNAIHAKFQKYVDKYYNW